MKRFPIWFIFAGLLAALVGCDFEGGDPTEAVPSDAFQVFYVPSIANLWDGAEQLLAELREIEPKMAEEALGEIEGLARLLFTDDEPPVKSLQELWDKGVDVEKPFIAAVGGFPSMQPVILFSVHDPSKFNAFYYESIREEEPEPVETYADVEVRLSRGVYSAQTEGLFIASESFSLMKGCIDALGDPELRFFEGEAVRPLLAKYGDQTAAVLVDMGFLKGFMTLAMMQMPEISQALMDAVKSLEAVGAGINIQPGGITLSFDAVMDLDDAGRLEDELPIPGDSLAFLKLKDDLLTPEEKSGVAGYVLQMLRMEPKAAAAIDIIGEENLLGLVESVGDRFFFCLLYSGWMPSFTLCVELSDPELFKLIYDEKLRPLLSSLLAEELDGATLERRVKGDVEMDVLTIKGPLILPITPAIAFYDDYLILTIDGGMVDRIREVDLGLSEGIRANEDYLLVEGLLPGYDIYGFASVDRLVENLAMTPGLELPEAAQLLGGHYGLLSMGNRYRDGVAEVVLLICTRTYSPDSTITRTEISRGLPWWLWLVIGLGALLIVILLVVLVGRRRREA